MSADHPPELPITGTRTKNVTESVIRMMTREALRHDAINLSQGIPDEEETPAAIKETAKTAIDEHSQYTITWGLPELRRAVADRYEVWKGISYDPDREVTITCGTSEAIMSTILACCDADDGVIYFEPTYENYIPSVQFAGGRGIPIDITDDMRLDSDALQDAAQEATALLLNTPHNPTGKVFTEPELELIADVAVDENLVVVTDEIYEHIVYDEAYISPVQVGDLADRTVLCTGLSKTYSVTGWRVGWALAPEPLTAELRKIHDYTSICAPTPFQYAGIDALSLPDDYYRELSASYEARRDLLYEGLMDLGLRPRKPAGSYYMMARYDTDEDDTEFALRLVREAGVATVPGSSFYTDNDPSTDWIRFTFSRSEATIRDALDRLAENRWW